MSSSAAATHFCEICLWSSKSKIGKKASEALFGHHLLVHVNKDDKFRLAFLHRRQHRGSKQVKLQCDYCSKMSRRTYAFKHFVTLHSNLSDSDKQVYRRAKYPIGAKQCDVCLQEIRSNVFNHFWTKHTKLSDEDKHICDHCEYAPLNSASLATHWLIMHTAPISEEQQKKIQCDICLKEFDFQTDGTAPIRNLYQHFLVRHSNAAEKFVCDVCSHVSTTRENLWSHVNWAGHLAQTESAKPLAGKLVCDICGIECINKRGVLYHYRFKHLNKNELETFDCEKCGFSTNIKGLLSAHAIERCMLKRVRYQCEDCKRLLKTRIALCYHRRNHHKNTQYVCDVCDRSYIGKQSVSDHCCAGFVP